MSNLTLIAEFYAGYNQLSGSLPVLSTSVNTSRSDFYKLSVPANRLVGTDASLLAFVRALPALQYLDVADNAFSGGFTFDVALTPRLILLNFSSNHFNGYFNMPVPPASRTFVFDASRNTFYCPFPTCAHTCSSRAHCEPAGSLPALVFFFSLSLSFSFRIAFLWGFSGRVSGSLPRSW